MRSSIAFALILAASPLTAGEDSKWQFAGESQGISFQLKIRNQCKDGSKVTVKLKSVLDRVAVVSFRINDSDWRKTFTSKVRPDGKETMVTFAPGENTVCHPYIDQVYIEGEAETVTQSTEDAATL